MSVTYTIGANPAVTIPSGIFTLPSTYVLQLAPTAITDVGVYTITVVVTDPGGLSATSSFTFTVTNTAPTWASNPGSWSTSKLN